MSANHAALMFSDWTESEAARRISTLRGCGWTPNQLASMFGVSTEEIDRLTGHDVMAVSGDTYGR